MGDYEKRGDTMANEQNLIPGAHKLTQEEQSEGGKKSGEVRRLKAAVKKALDGKVPEDMQELIKVLENAGVDTTNDNGIAFAVVLKALKGDLSAATWIRDIVGEKPKDELQIGGDGVVIIAGSDKIAD